MRFSRGRTRRIGGLLTGLTLALPGALAAAAQTSTTDTADATLPDTSLVGLASDPQADPDALIDAAIAARIGWLNRDDGRVSLAALERWPRLQRLLGLHLHEADDHQKAVRLAATLAAKDDRLADELAPLIAAMAVVHDRQIGSHPHLSGASADAPERVYSHFVRHRRQLIFDPRETPVRLLAFMVNPRAPVQELAWAIDHYGGNSDVGSRFHDIRYDYAYFKTGREREVMRHGYSLPNVRKYGGVCADQAYFAATVGKSIGVPSAYVVGVGGDVSHAWVGFLDVRRGKRPEWNFDAGRYEVYQGVRGRLEDPQTGDWIDDSRVGLTAGSLGRDETQRLTALALAEAARELTGVRPSMFDPVDEDAPEPDSASQAGSSEAEAEASPDPQTEAALAIVRRALEANPYEPRVWDVLADLAEADRLTHEQKAVWASALMRLCGDAYPDFTFDVLRPLIRTVDDPRRAHEVWERLRPMARQRKDVLAAIRMEQASAWREAGEPKRAWACYQAVVSTHVNDGPFVLDALQEMNAMVIARGKPEAAAAVYQGAWAKADKPGGMAEEFMRQSNYVRLGRAYADLLESLGDTRSASRVHQQIERVLN
ncbi:MAG: hypothetical protein AAFY08_13995 [Planctomycetota bacterium]